MTTINSWIPLHDLPADKVTPPCYHYEQLKRDDINELLSGISDWYPDIEVGSGRRYLDHSFYAEQTYLAGETVKDRITYVGKFEGKIIAAMCLELHHDSSVIYSRFGVCAPQHRRTGASLFAAYAIDAQAKGLGLAMAYCYVTLKSPAMQLMLEKAGFRPVGILPCSDREMVAPQDVKYVTEVLYCKTYAHSSEIATVAPEQMSEQVRRLWDYLQAGQRGSV